MFKICQNTILFHMLLAQSCVLAAG